MKRQIIGAVGYFDMENTIPNGQTIRTNTVTAALERAIGKRNVKRLCYGNWRKRPLSLLWSFLQLAHTSRIVLVFPDENAVRFIIPLLVLTKKLFRIKIYYNVIGGWLPGYLKKHPRLARKMKRLDGLFVQTSVLKNALEQLGISNVTIFPNFKYIKVLDADQTKGAAIPPYPLCFLSRITEMKGVGEMISVVTELNRDQVRFTLDIYGEADEDYREPFQELLKQCPSTIRFCGAAPSNQTSEILSNYFLQLFPTKYRTEGFPGSVLDSFCAGVPVLAARWDSWADVITEGQTGLTFELGDFQDMKRILEDIYQNPALVTDMRQTCLEAAKLYQPENVIKIMLEAMQLDG